MMTYRDYYEKNYASKIRRIDLYLKTLVDKKITITDVSELLSLSSSEIGGLMELHQIKNMDIFAFFVFMQNGSSPLCRLFAREVSRKMPHFYSYYDISYIYQIPYEHVVKAANKAKLNHITASNIHQLFDHIILKTPHYTLKN